MGINYSVERVIWHEFEIAVNSWIAQSESERDVFFEFFEHVFHPTDIDFDYGFCLPASEYYSHLRTSLDGHQKHSCDIVIASFLPHFLVYGANRPKKKEGAIPFDKVTTFDIDLPCDTLRQVIVFAINNETVRRLSSIACEIDIQALLTLLSKNGMTTSTVFDHQTSSAN